MKNLSPKRAYNKYKKDLESTKVKVLFDEKELPVMIQLAEVIGMMEWSEWLDSEMEWALEEEYYEYCAKLNKEIKKLKK